jgi:hypothetical protein
MMIAGVYGSGIHQMGGPHIYGGLNVVAIVSSSGIVRYCYAGGMYIAENDDGEWS